MLSAWYTELWYTSLMNLNKTQQGDVGVAAAKFHYMIEGAIVSAPETEQVKYDLIIDRGNGLERVQVKTSSYKPTGRDTYEVTLRTIGGNRSTQKNITKVVSENVDILFILTMDGSCYEIPVGKIDGMSSVYLGPKYKDYLVRHIGALTVLKHE